jgi:hypothetical protein
MGSDALPQNIGSALADARLLDPGADDGTRTRDPHLGKVMLYQLSHVRESAQGTKAAGDGHR